MDVTRLSVLFVKNVNLVVRQHNAAFFGEDEHELDFDLGGQEDRCYFVY